MNVRELAEQTNVTIRQIRFLIAEGFVPPPSGTRARPEYDDDHVAAVDRYMVLRQSGLPPSAIRVVMEVKTATELLIVPGIRLKINPEQLKEELNQHFVQERIRILIKSLVKESSDGERMPEEHRPSKRRTSKRRTAAKKSASDEPEV